MPSAGQRIGKAFAATVDLDRLLELSEASGGREPDAATRRRADTETGKIISPRRRVSASPRRILAVARDAAFCFYYPENLELLEAAGGEIVYFSPLQDVALPAGTQLIYLGGGYPELHAAALASNEPLRRVIQQFHRKGGTIYAECGGLMYTCRELVDVNGTAFPMLDLLPARTVMQARRAALGYVALRTVRESPLGPAATMVRGHEFHYSRLEALGTARIRQRAGNRTAGRFDLRRTLRGIRSFALRFQPGTCGRPAGEVGTFPRRGMSNNCGNASTERRKTTRRCSREVATRLLVGISSGLLLAQKFDINEPQSPAKPMPKWVKMIDQGKNDPRLKG